MTIDNALVEAYKDAEYVVFTDTEFVMLVDTYSDPLQQLMTSKPFSQAALITAFNPYSEILDESENLKRQNALSKELNDFGFEFLQGLGRDKERQWPGERSVLVLNIPIDVAKKLGNKYGQNAIIWIEEDAIPQLLLLEGKTS
jgi:hypothetical protein